MKSVKTQIFSNSRRKIDRVLEYNEYNPFDYIPSVKRDLTTLLHGKIFDQLLINTLSHFIVIGVGDTSVF